MNANNTFSIVTRLQAALGHPLIKRQNLGFTLEQPFAWSLISAADVLARMEPAVADTEVGDQLRIKMATLRHFNRQVGHNDIGMGTINACLRPDEDISLEQIKETAKDRVKIEVRSGKCKKSDIKVRFTKLYMDMYEAAQAKQRQRKALLDEVFFLCNRTDEELAVGNFERMLEAGIVYKDEELVDYDQFDYMVEGLLDRCVMPCVRAKEAIQAVMDKSYRTEAIAAASALMVEIEKLGVEIGIDWKKMNAENAAIDASIKGAIAEDAATDASIDSILDDVDLCAAVEPEPAPAPKRVTVKSPERLAREAEEARVAAEKAEHAQKQAAKAAKAAATRAANKAKKAASA